MLVLAGSKFIGQGGEYEASVFPASNILQL